MDIKIKIILSEEDCARNISGLYDSIAKQLGYENISSLQYDCRKVSVSKSIFDKIHEYYKAHHISEEGFAKNWCCFGPKADLPDEGFVVEIQNGFIIPSQEGD